MTPDQAFKYQSVVYKMSHYNVQVRVLSSWNAPHDNRFVVQHYAVRLFETSDLAALVEYCDKLATDLADIFNRHTLFGQGKA